jgi:hypothetical protein
MGPPALLPIRRKASCGFSSPSKSIILAGFKPANLRSNCKHANHYTTEGTPRDHNLVVEPKDGSSSQKHFVLFLNSFRRIPEEGFQINCDYLPLTSSQFLWQMIVGLLEIFEIYV